MIYAQIDLFTVFLASLVNAIVSYFWYSRWLFGELWMQLSDSSLEKRSMALLWSFFVVFFTAYILAFLQALLGVTTVTDGMFTGFLVWAGFVATTQLSQVIWNGMSFRLFLLETSCRLVTLVSMGGILGA